MLVDTLSVSRWFALHKGFSAKKECFRCQGPLSHYRAFEKDSSGILSRCENCGKEIVRLRVNNKAPFNGDSSVNDQIFRRVRKGAGLVEGFNGGVVEFLHS